MASVNFFPKLLTATAGNRVQHPQLYWKADGMGETCREE